MVDEYLAGKDPTRVVPDDERTQVEVLKRGGNSYEVLVTAPASTDVLFRIHYFPGWQAYVDGKPVETAIRPPQGLMAVAVPEGSHHVLLRFEDTPLRRVSKVISLLGLLAAAGLLLWAWRLERKTKRA